MTSQHKMPARLEPMRARTTRLPDDGAEWSFEIKWDGIRALAFADHERLRLQSRTMRDITGRYPELGGLAAALGGQRAILDGEVVCLDAEGRPDFQLLQSRIHLTGEARVGAATREQPATFMAFDLLWLDDEDLMPRPYVERRQLLEGLVLAGPHWQTPPVHTGDAEAMLAVSQANGLEGIVAKRLDSPYVPGSRSAAWVKHRHMRRQELVIGGWRVGQGARSALIGSVLVGHWDVTPEQARRRSEPQRLLYAGGVGSGFTDLMLEQVSRLVRERERAETPFDVGDPMAHGSFPHPKRDVRFCEPELVCDVAFAEWTRDGTLRAPSFKGLRDDVDPRQIVREPG